MCPRSTPVMCLQCSSAAEMPLLLRRSIEQGRFTKSAHPEGICISGVSAGYTMPYQQRYCVHATIPRSVSAYFVRKSRVFQREIASFRDFCASVIIRGTKPAWWILCDLVERVTGREMNSNPTTKL